MIELRIERDLESILSEYDHYKYSNPQEARNRVRSILKNLAEAAKEEGRQEVKDLYIQQNGKLDMFDLI